jgi:serine/threonine protein kinase
MPTFEAGQVFDRYHIIRWLGSGVSGESYEAEDSILLRKVALKLIHPQETLPDAARRQFFREMQSISALSHPYIAPVLDYGEINGRLYVARRYVGNGSLLSPGGRLWFRSPLNISDAITYTHQVAQALHSIHLRGNVHGAVTFANILVLRGPNLDHLPDYAPFLLADAGLAQFVRRSGQQRQQPLLPVSAAPEQLGRRIIPASDQYALAVLLYSWLSGRPPFTGTPEEVQRLKLTETITPLSTINAQVTIEQDGMLLRALSVFPEDRYPTVLAFAEALLNTLAGKHEEADSSETIATDITTPNLEAVSPSQPVDVSPVPMPVLPDTDTPEPLDGRPGVPSFDHARVIIASPYTNDPLEISLAHDEMTVGRAGSSDILLDHDNLTSRHHALFRREGHGYLIFDRRSANGVFVNGQKISSEEGYELRDGDHISVGNYELIFRSSLPDNASTTNGNSAEPAAQHQLTRK